MLILPIHEQSTFPFLCVFSTSLAVQEMQVKTTMTSSSQDGGIGRNPSFPCTTKRKDNNQSKINKQPKAPEKSNCWNSDNQGIKEKINQNNKTSKVAEQVGQLRNNTANQQLVGRLLRGSKLLGQGWLKVKLRLSGSCGLGWLLRWEILPVSHERVH